MWQDFRADVAGGGEGRTGSATHLATRLAVILFFATRSRKSYCAPMQMSGDVSAWASNVWGFRSIASGVLLRAVVASRRCCYRSGLDASYLCRCPSSRTRVRWACYSESRSPCDSDG